MRYLGVDYGTKRVGLALSDVEGKMAFPLRTVAVGSRLVPQVISIIKEEKVDAVVLGDSRDFEGKENPLMRRVHSFRKELEEGIDAPIYFEPELFTSQEAQRIQGKVPKLDASAAALILQSFLDKQINMQHHE